MLMKVPKNAAYKILRNLNLQTVPCETEDEIEASKKLGELSPGRLVDQLQSFANTDAQTAEMNRRCRAAGLRFYFDAGHKVQFKREKQPNG